MFHVRHAGPGDESIVRALRLEAMTRAPEAFGSTYERELARTPADWQRWLSTGATFILMDAERATGIVAGLHDRADPAIVHLLSMWVDPASRGAGAADALVASVLSWARAEGAGAVRLAVIDTNLRARRCYERNGFRATGTQFVRERDGATELQMEHTFDPVGDSIAVSQKRDDRASRDVSRPGGQDPSRLTMNQPRLPAASTMCAMLLAGSMTASSQSPAPAPFELPAPTGPYPIGTTSWHVTDRSRRETFAASGEFRQVEVLAWYPAERRGGAIAPYLREGAAEVRPFAKLFGAELALDKLEHVRTHAELDALPAQTAQKLPLLVFSHGYTGMPSSYTALMEDLASHGYAVLSVVHPFEAGAATLADGRVVSMNGPDGKFRQGIQDVLAEWAPEDRTMTAVTSATEDGEQIRLLREYLGTLRRTGVMLRRWVDDTTLVLDRLAGLPAKSVASALAARLDMSRIGAFGHSMGGVTSAQFCVEDSRCRAGLNLDGIPQYGPMIDTPMARPFLMVYSERPGRAGASDPIYRRSARPYYRVDMKGTRHLEFSDMPFWGDPLRPALGSLPPARAAELTGLVVRQYFDQELRGERSALLAGTTVPPELTVKIVTPARP